ncbi:Alpha-tubulin N-acetyltransferase 1 [Mortierella sp. GBA43]|nr:Alpha-tubulin N-acetyltransferase 1 [Mortierella sp. GBA43]
MAVTELMDGIMSVQEQESKKSTRTRDEEKGVRVAGMLKMGEKKLFIVDKSGRMHEQHVCCVLDFYVDESSQRRGFGKLLFDYMIKVEGIDPTQIAYDRPSPKLFRFLNKYFGLKRHLPQPNMYAIFEGFKLDCGETIQVDDSILPAGRGSPTFETSSLFPADGNANGFNQGGTKPTAVNRALQSSLVFSSEVSVNSSGDATGTKPIVVNRGLQSSSVFNSEPKLDSSSPSSGRTTGTRPVVINRALQSSLVFGSGVPFESSENSGRQQHHKRVSSAFSSSFSLSGSGPPAGTPRTGTAASDRITPFLTSSIVFADPVTD